MNAQSKIEVFIDIKGIQPWSSLNVLVNWQPHKSASAPCHSADTWMRPREESHLVIDPAWFLLSVYIFCVIFYSPSQFLHTTAKNQYGASRRHPRWHIWFQEQKKMWQVGNYYICLAIHSTQAHGPSGRHCAQETWICQSYDSELNSYIYPMYRPVTAQTSFRSHRRWRIVVIMCPSCQHQRKAIRFNFDSKITLRAGAS